MASKFKEQCLALLDQVATTKVPVIVTKHGRPVARLMPLPDPRAGNPTMGSVELLADDDYAYYTSGAHWDADPELEPG
jgi:prevent-host-death family protein